MTNQRKGTQMQTIIRQGDVCLVRVAQLPKGATEAKIKDKKRVVLAYGEVTGHAHAIYEPTKARLWDAGVERFLQVMERCELCHEEHSAHILDPDALTMDPIRQGDVLLLPVGRLEDGSALFRLPQQVEYSPAELKRVAD